MNMKKTFGVCATLLTALLCAVPQSARAYGKIRAVDAYDPSGARAFPNPGDALKVGDEVYIRFRLINLMWGATHNDPSFVNPWFFVFPESALTGNETLDQLQQLAANKPRLGLWVNGEVREAECVNFPLGVASDWLSDVLGGQKHYTDLIFKYTVEPGDLALPIQLADASGKGPADGSDSGNPPSYYLKCNGQDVLWMLQSSNTTGKVTAEFAFGPDNLPQDDHDFDEENVLSWNIAKDYENRDLDLTKAGVYVQAIDFDASYSDEAAGIWRTIAQGSTTANPGVPTLEIQGTATKTIDLYLWTDDTNVAEVVKGGKVISTEQLAFGDNVTRTVGKVRITAGDESVPFSVKATGVQDQTTRLYLSSSPTNIYNGAGDLITNFVVRTIKVGEPLPPSINVTVDGKASATVTANADHSTALVNVNVKLSEAWPGPGALTVPVKVTVKNDAALDAKDYVRMSQASIDDNLGWDDELSVDIGADTATLPLWMYANRGTTDTENGLLVEVDTNRLDAAARAFFTGKFIAATVVVNRSTPEITSALPPITDVEANSPKEITINVADAYGELHDPCRYTVYWSRSGGVSASDYVVIPDLAATASGDLTFSVTYLQKGDYTSRFYVENQDGKKSDPLAQNASVSVSVKAQKVVEATTLQKKFPEDAFNDQEVVTLTFGGEEFSMPNGETEGYIFFVPRNANASNLVDCADLNIDDDRRWMAGYPVYAGETEAGPFLMTLYDGDSKGITMGYDVIVRTAERWDEGTTVTSWNSKGFSFGVTNVVPEVTQVSMSGTRLKVNGGTMGTHASLGVSKTFTAVTTEPSDLDLYADEDNNYQDDQKSFTTEWTFDYGNGAPDVRYVYGPPSTVLSYAFTQAGNCTVSVRMCDKDMDHNRDVWGPEFTFTVVVDAKPAINISPITGLTVFYETDVGQTYGKFNVGLTMAPTAEITVHLDVTRTAEGDNYPLPVLNTYDVTFGGSSPYTTNAPIWFTALDGTALGESAGYMISAVVTNTTMNADGVAWTNLYSGYSLPVTVVNMDPEITTRAGTNEIWKAENENFRIQYAMRDVPADVSAGLSVTWMTSEGFSTNYTVTATSIGGAYTTYKGSSPEFAFKSAGSKTVTLIVEDKDGGYDQQQWKYYVVPSKAVHIYPRQPDQIRGRSGNLSAYSAYYTGAAGLGDGRVWTSGSVVDFNSFMHKYTFDPTVSTVDIYARGYKVGDVDDGTLLPGPDITIDANGNHYKSGVYSSYYESKELNGLDSYFYCWILNTKGEGGSGYTGSLLNGTLNPAVEVRGEHVADGHQRVSLPDYEEDADSYQTTELEAIFSKERYPADNVGDINQDGVPDVYAVNRTYSGGKLFEFAAGVSSGDAGATDTASADDVKNSLTDFNGDGDYLPPATIAGGGVPDTADGWVNFGQPFTAEQEVRGFHSGLNYRALDNGKNYNVRGSWVSEPSFSPAESNAIVYMNKKLGVHEFVWPVDMTNAEHIANWEQGLNKDNSWIPENRTDPTMEDTDGDGFSDGFEYYFWYQATVGWIDEKGKWKRLEGERFQLQDIAKGVPISPDEIAELFNPTVKATGDLAKRDSDNDGLTDLEEFALGTNPLHWDTDGDGMSDLWEVMRGMNPLKAPAEKERNLDGDYMASFTTGKTYAIAQFTDAEGATVFYALPDNGGSILSELLNDDQDGDQDGDQNDDDPVADDGENEGGLSNITAIAVYRYGGSGSAYTPVSCGTYGKDESISYLGKKGQKRTSADNTHKAWGDIRIATSKPLDAAEVDISELTFVSVETNKALRLVHDQVYAQFGFDPRTAWGRNVNGYVCNRWDPNMNPVHAADIGEAGLAVHTEPYSNLDEYLVLKFRYMTRDANGKVRRNLQSDLSKVAANQMTIAGVFAEGTTNPNVPFEEVDYTVTGAPSDNGDSSESEGENSLIPTYTSKNHGADTDEDGVPDGWELYVMFDPNNKLDGIVEVDGDDLSLVNEYAGTDSCIAYSNAVSTVTGSDSDSDSGSEGEKKVATIYENHPGLTKGWFNKFFPTDPWDIDTDGDGLSDRDEGSTWSATFRLGNSSDQDPLQHTYTFIYGDPADDGSLCIRGGGLNPCTVDTDFDLLPDAWEHDFAGVVFKGGKPWTPEGSTYGTSITLSGGVLEIINRNDAINSASGAVSVAECYITAGMDGTFGPRKDNAAIVGDAVTSYAQVDPRTGTKRNFDFDNDGLQNFQEYLVQSLRHLRYDDTETPLMGSYLPDGVAGTRTYVKFLPMQAWDGAAFYKTAKAAGFTGLSTRGGEGFRYRDLGYFIRPPKAWDPLAQNTVGLNACVNYAEPGYRVMLRPAGLSSNADAGTEDRFPAERYACTDPRLWDSDEDGMDDYYELFHGLNPLLGNEDVISKAYMVAVGGIPFSSYYNAWVGWPMIPLLEPIYDAMMYPWFMGVAEADADGDGLRNTDEALLVNTPSPQNYHTDPTPLWMTDSSAKTSFTKQYYCRDVYMTEAMQVPDLTAYFWFTYVDGADQGDVVDFMFSFEENEGYDTDHDWLPDGHELTTTVLSKTDPQNAFDPDRREALYLPGEKAALISYSGDFNRPVGENYAMLRQFTVEAWIRPEAAAGAQTIVTRVSDYPGDTLSNAVHQLRANFRIGINDQGYLYGQYDSDDAVPSGSDFGTTTVLGIPAEWNVWTHVALTYDGSALVLYLNGTEVNRVTSGLIPANGLVLTGQSVTPAGANFGSSGYSEVPSRLIVGADAAKVEAMQVDAKSSWANYGSFYKGWIDEVRVWDGARKPSQIVADYKKRYSFADLSALRDGVYAAWLVGGTHNNNDGLPDLPAELLLYFNCRNLPSEVTADYVASEPSGFTAKVVDNVKWNGHSVDLRCGWWSAIPLASEVYGNRAYVPWIRNMAGSLPAMDGSTPDSRYWSELLGGVTLPLEVGVAKFSFPNTACPYAYWNYMGESYFRDWLLFQLKDSVGEGLDTAAKDVLSRFRFDQRTGFLGGADLLPLGGVFAKRCVDYWDGQGATDAWTATADDLDIDDLPDWWEALYAGVNGNPDEITPTTVVTYEGRQVTAREAYFRDLAKGLLPGGSLTDLPTAYASKADNNFNDIPDWWESIYGIISVGSWSDADADQLSDYVEWLVGYGFAANDLSFPAISPVKARSLQSAGQIVPDYFLPVGSLYLGGMFTDHDFMEDAWEVNFPAYTSTGVYDAHLDPDEDGWSNFAECRAGTSPSSIAYLGVDEMSVPDYPVPTVKVTAKYNGTKPTSGMMTYVQAWRADDMSGQPDAAWQIVSSGSVSSDAATGTSSGQGSSKKTSTAHTKLIGMNPNREITLTLGPGSVTPGSIQFSFKDLAWKSISGYVRDDNGVERVVSSSLGGAEWAVWVRAAVDRVRPGSANWGDIIMISSNSVAGAVNEATVGEVNYQTGATTIDLSKMQGLLMYDRGYGGSGSDMFYSWRYVFYSQIDLSISQVRVDWSSKFAAQGFPQTYYLADSATADDGVISRGRLREGKNVFVAFVDLDGNGAWTPGEPYGAAADVDVGWSGTSCEIEMMDTTPQLARVDVAAAIKATDFANANNTTDRGQVNLNLGMSDNVPSLYPGTNMPANASSLTKVRVVRNKINGEVANGSQSYSAVVLERNLDLAAHPLITEADLFGDGVYDLDWGNLISAYGNATLLESATYRIVIGDDDVGDFERDCEENLAVQFVNRFEARQRQTPTVPDSALAEIVYAGQPTFRWSHTNSIDKAYPAFQLRIYASDKSKVIYDSGVRQAPARDVKGMYEWTAPVYAGMITPERVVFDTTNIYYWSVSMLDAKFTNFSASEVKVPFRLSCTGNISDGHGYGSIKVAVKYFGPLVGSLSTSASKLQNLIHVQAFTTPDFTGMPVGEAYVTNVADIASTSNVTVNAIIRGVPAGTYYVRAYVDTDGDFKKAAWETWGYGCYVGDAGAPFITIGRGNLKNDKATAANFPYTPRGYKVERNVEVPVATVYMEDTDWEFDGFPDAWEMEKYGLLGTRAPITGNTFFATVNPNLLASLTAYKLSPSVASTTAHLGFTLMGSILNGRGNSAVMAASLLSGESAEETTAVRIKSFSLEGGLDLEVVNESVADTAGVIVFADEATVQLYIVCAASPDFSDAVEVPVKEITIRSNDTVVEAVTAEEIAAARAQAPEARFFKAVIK